ncbi:hypothetical protein [Ornithinibacillus bavariensis]|uniref:hypothetical protein n=1 Tax=Ornithinibacillus bavariensis TaxID=545502 RepID=UPI001BB35E28|nr:hypothetical protein [Ornithinibacillus bavariensis]
MISIILIILYCIMMLLAAFMMLYKNHESLSSSQIKVLYFYIAVHALFLCFALLEIVGVTISMIFYLFIIVLILISRYINGRIIYNKNHWQHYIVFGGFFLLILVLKTLHL